MEHVRDMPLEPPDFEEPWETEEEREERLEYEEALMDEAEDREDEERYIEMRYGRD